MTLKWFLICDTLPKIPRGCSLFEGLTSTRGKGGSEAALEAGVVAAWMVAKITHNTSNIIV
jgi:hypothetical protein